MLLFRFYGVHSTEKRENKGNHELIIQNMFVNLIYLFFSLNRKQENSIKIKGKSKVSDFRFFFLSIS